MSLKAAPNPSHRVERNLIQSTIAEYSNYLKHAGFGPSSIKSHTGPARHILVWLEHTRTSPEVLDGCAMRRFINHDCTCPLPNRRDRRERAMKSGKYVYWFGRFLEYSGRSSSPSKLEDLLKLLESFLMELAVQGYKSSTRELFRHGCFHFSVWLNQERIAIREIDDTILERYFGHTRICIAPGRICRPERAECRRRRHGPALRKFVSFLTDQGVVPKRSARQPQLENSALSGFSHWCRQHRGIGEETIREHVRHVERLLAELGVEPERYTAALIQDVLLRCLDSTTRSTARQTAGSLRMYLRYLASEGRCSATLVDAVPNVSDWKLSTLPQYLSPEQVAHAIACCSRSMWAGRRDRAILLLLSVLGLRASDIVNLQMTDIDWCRAELRVSGKSRCEAALPLPQSVGDALLDYILNERPNRNRQRVFLGAVAPHRPFSGPGAVSRIASAALARAGIDRVGKPSGAHVFRHTAATTLVRAGASLEVVGALLRHRSLNATAVYSKVDLAMLAQVAQPWIEGGERCR